MILLVEAYNSFKLFILGTEFDKLNLNTGKGAGYQMPYQDLGRRIKQQRILAQMTQEKLAEKAGISLSFLGHIERGTRKASLDTLVKLCNALKVSPRVLLQDSLMDDLLGDNVEISEPQRKLLREISNRIIEYNAMDSDNT